MGVVDGEMFDLSLHLGGDGAADDDRLLELRDLKVARAVGIEVGFAVEFAEESHVGIDGAAELDGFSHSLFVEDGQGSGLAGADFGDVGVGFIAKAVGRGAEEFRSCV